MGKLLLTRQLGEDTDPQRAGNHGDSPESLERTETSDVMGWTGEALARERADTPCADIVLHTSFHPHDDSLRKVLLLSPHHRGGSGG